MEKDAEVKEAERARIQDRCVLNCVLHIQTTYFIFFFFISLHESPDWPLNELLHRGHSVS